MKGVFIIKNEKHNRLGEERLNNQGCLMRIVEYNTNKDIIIEFQDNYKARLNTQYGSFVLGEVKNPYYPSVCGIGMIGCKYPSKINRKITKEYKAWAAMLHRCFDKNTKERQITYESVDCCKEWLLFDNFYDWLHSQENFNQWLDGERWALDKDILIKGNKIYSPETCCLIPQNVNCLFTKCESKRGNLPIGVCEHGNGFQSYCHNPFTNNKMEYLGTHETPTIAFYYYKKFKENIIKQVAEIEYKYGNITKQCYEAMMNYEVEITD